MCIYVCMRTTGPPSVSRCGRFKYYTNAPHEPGSSVLSVCLFVRVSVCLSEICLTHHDIEIILFAFKITFIETARNLKLFDIYSQPPIYIIRKLRKLTVKFI